MYEICPRQPTNASHRQGCPAAVFKPAQFKPANDRPGETMRCSVELANERAICALGHVLTNGAEAATAVHAWTTWIQVRQQGGNSLTVLEHTVMAYILRSEFLDRFPGSRSHRDIESALRTSWLHLMGQRVVIQNLTGRLPRSVLRKASREERLFHLAAFQPSESKVVKLHNSIRCDYVPELRDLATAAGLAVVACTDTGSSMLVSGGIGYAIATVAEYGMHRWAGHEAGGPLKPLLEKSGWIGRKVSEYLAATYLGHFVIHHVKTSNRNYTTQFAREPPGDRSTIDAELDALGEVGQSIKKSDYGMSLTHAGVTAGVLVALPIHLTLIWGLGLEFLSTVALITPSLLYVVASRNFHPCLHKRREEALARSGPFMRLLLGTRYAEWISRSHWIHHKGGGGNYNLVPGADVLFGDFRKPNLNMVLRMRADGILGAVWNGAGIRTGAAFQRAAVRAWETGPEAHCPR